jgi:putative tricarboxylic transport membrane protein
VLVGFGVFGYGLRKLAIDPSPLVVALVLGPMMEKTLRQSLFMSRGNVLEIVSRPLTLTLLILGLVALVAPLVARRLRGGAISAEPARPAR